MSQSDTPRVEEAHRWIWAESGDPVARYRLCLDFARRLARELVERDAEKLQLHGVVGNLREQLEQLECALAAEQERAQAALASCAVLAGLCEVQAVSPTKIEPHRQHIEQGMRALEAARERALEEAAKVCDERGKWWRTRRATEGIPETHCADEAENCAFNILALKATRKEG